MVFHIITICFRKQHDHFLFFFFHIFILYAIKYRGRILTAKNYFIKDLLHYRIIIQDITHLIYLYLDARIMFFFEDHMFVFYKTLIIIFFIQAYLISGWRNQNKIINNQYLVIYIHVKPVIYAALNFIILTTDVVSICYTVIE